MARTATAAAVAGLAAAAAAWFAPSASLAVRLPAAAPGAAQQPAAAVRWESQATDSAAVPDAVLQAAAGVEIAVIDTGADMTSPDLAARQPQTYDVFTHGSDVQDTYGHGTFVASIASASGGAARLLIIKAADRTGLISVAGEAAAIRYAVTHGARIVNLSFAGPATSPVERAAIRFAIRRGVLVVAAAGNGYQQGDPVEYPAALLQPVGSKGHGGAGLVVAASGLDGARAPFSSSGSWISLAAPGVQILGAVSRLSPPTAFTRAASATTDAPYGFGNGTSFAAPQVAGAAALVWSANPSLTARSVAAILEQTASAHGTWTPELGYGVIDVAAAVAAAQAAPVAS
jgi:subtilisin family serine protease